MSSEHSEQKRGKKRTLDELESEAIEPPNPKRRKISPQNNNNNKSKKNQHHCHNNLEIDDNENNAIQSYQHNKIKTTKINHNSISNHNNNNHHNHDKHHNNINHKTTSSIEKHLESIPNAITNSPSPSHQIIDLSHSNSPKRSKLSNNHNHTNHDETDIEMEDNENDSEEKETENSNLSQLSNSSNGNNFSSIIRSSDAENKYFEYLSIYTDERCLIHAIPDEAIIEEFNERPARLQALIQMIEDEKWNQFCRFIPKLESVPHIEEIEGLHKSGYLADLKNSCSKIYAGNWNVAQGSDTYIVKQTFDAALVSAGLVIQATKHVFSHIPPLPFNTPSVSLSPRKKSIQNTSNNVNATNINGDKMDIDDKEIIKDIKDKNDADAHINCNDKHENNGKLNLSSAPTEIINDDNTNSNPSEVKKYAVVLNRPPGHHCDGEKYSGYCYINSTAVAIEKQLNQDTKVLVLDIDVHHGDGTQKLFYTEPTVLTVSFHQYDGHFFPTSGTRTEYGPSRRHKAYGTNINVPLGAGSTDLDVLYGLRKMVWKIVEKFKPDIAFYAVGTDGVANDKANNSTIFTPSLYGQIAYELRKYVNLIVVTTEGGYTTEYLANGMSCVLHGLTDQINTEHYPQEIKDADILPSTIHTIAATTSDLRKVYDFPVDATEFAKIFNGANLKTHSVDSSFELNNESMYIPNDGDEDDDYMEDIHCIHGIDGEEEEFFGDFDRENKEKKKKKKEKKEKKKDDGNKDKDKKKKKDKDKEKKKKKKKKKNKESKENPIDLTADNDADKELNEETKSKKKKDKKSKKKKRKDKERKNKKNKHKDKDKEKEKKTVSKTVNKKNKSSSNVQDGGNKDIEVIDLIEDSPVRDTANIEDKDKDKDKKKRKKKKKDKNKDKSKSKKKKRNKHKMSDRVNGNDDEEVENNSDINNLSNNNIMNNTKMTNLSTMFALNNIIGSGINTLAINETHNENGKNFIQRVEEQEQAVNIHHDGDNAAANVIVIDSE